MGNSNNRRIGGTPYMKRMLTGAPTLIGSPDGDSAPVDASMLNTATVFDRWFPAINQRPLGSMAKLRGVWPRVGSYSTSVSAPSKPTLNTAMLSCPRFEP